MLTANEFTMSESVPLYRVQEAIFEFCRGRRDTVIFGAQAVNVHVAHPRMSQDVDLLATDPQTIADALAATIRKKLHIAARVREVKPGKAYRVYQVRRDVKRHLADVRLAEFPLKDIVERRGVRYTSVPLTLAMKVCALVKRRLAPKGATDLADIRRLLLAHSELRKVGGPVAGHIDTLGGGSEAIEAWRQLVAEPVVSDDDADEGY
jgi:hypothetical protein